MRPLLLAHMQVGKNGMVQIVASLGVLFLIGICYWMGNSIEVGTLLIIYGVASIASAALLFKYFSRDFHLKRKINFPLFKSIAKLGTLMSGNIMAQTLVSNAPLYALSWMLVSGFQDVGYFSRCISICMIATFINNAIGPLLYAKLTAVRRKRRGSKQNWRLFFLIIQLSHDFGSGNRCRVDHPDIVRGRVHAGCPDVAGHVADAVVQRSKGGVDKPDCIRRASCEDFV